MEDFPKPKSITGGCLCGALRYEVTFAPDHDFKSSFSTCQCTQCRRQTSSLFLAVHRVRPAKNYVFTTPTTTLATFKASPDAERGFCSACGSLMYWRHSPPSSSSTAEGEGKGGGEGGNQKIPPEKDYVCMTIGTVDPLFLFGEGADGITTGGGTNTDPVPKDGYGYALASGEGDHWWCRNLIKGVTDDVPVAGWGRGRRWETE